MRTLLPSGPADRGCRGRDEPFTYSLPVLSKVSLSQLEPVAGVEVLVLDENLADVVGVRGLAGEVVPYDLKDVAEPGGVVDVDVGDALVPAHEEGELEV